MYSKHSENWRALQSCAQATAKVSLQQLFAADPDRFTAFSTEAAGWLLDYSKQHLDETSLTQLCRLLEACEFEQARARLFAGDVVNVTEQQAAWHTALRAASPPSEVAATLQQLSAFVERVHRPGLLAPDAPAITDIIHLGIGGSDLGPALATQVLKCHQAAKVRVHYLANLDPTSLAQLLASLSPQTTLCLMVSKSFTTAETLTNATHVKTWLAQAGLDPLVHFCAVTAQSQRAQNWGIQPERIFPIWDWVGGRFSLWSAVGISIALQFGMATYQQMLAGARAMDEHFKTAPMRQNVPILQALIGIWNRNLLNLPTLAIVPYADCLRELPAYLQQLEMESNGKQADAVGHPVAWQTVPVIWGGVGCNAQHAFMQALHQGSQVVPVDFIVALQAPHFPELQQQLLANCLAQSQALLQGHQDVKAPWKNCPGNRPSSTLVCEQLNAHTLGSLLALYEHKVFTQGVVWGIQSFDQWGVQLGKQLATTMLAQLEQGQSSQTTLVGYCSKRLSGCG